MKIEISEETVAKSSLDAVRASFNPSGNERVDRIKLLGAALIEECELVIAENTCAAVVRAASVAMTSVETAVMWAVKAATFNK